MSGRPSREKKSIPKEVVTANGTVTISSEKFAYIKTSYGNVFVSASTVIDGSTSSSNLSDVLGFNDFVYVEATPQEEKNECKLKATKVNILSKQPKTDTKTDAKKSNDENGINVEVKITNVTENLAYAHHEDYGDIFIPKGSFKNLQPTDSFLKYLQNDDKVAAKIVRQKSINGCKYKSVMSSKIVINLKMNYTSGTAKITSVFDTVCLAKFKGQEIKCPIISYCPSRNDGDAESLTELFKKDDFIIFTAKLLKQSTSRAVEWYKVDKEKIKRDPIFQGNVIVK